MTYSSSARYGHIDFALAGALEGMDKLLHFIFTYNGACIYGQNLRRWFEERFPHLVPLLDRLHLLLPKLHALAHREVCQIVYALCYTWGAGLTHGETVEHPWAEHNQAGLSTREMSVGHRHVHLGKVKRLQLPLRFFRVVHRSDSSQLRRLHHVWFDRQTLETEAAQSSPI